MSPCLEKEEPPSPATLERELTLLRERNAALKEALADALAMLFESDFTARDWAAWANAARTLIAPSNTALTTKEIL